jgi:DNA repair photolyase
VCRAAGAKLRLPALSELRVGAVRVSGAAGQLILALDTGPAPWPLLDERARGTAFLGVSARQVLNPPAATGMGFWSLNPFIGCEFGCSYCYARDTHRWALERRGGEKEVTIGTGLGVHGARTVSRLGSPTPPAPHEHRGARAARPLFESRILVKRDAPRLLARTLDPERLGGLPLVIGTATDPYQPAERRFRITRQVLEVLAGFRGLHIGIITKSPLITRDRDLLVELHRRHRLSVHISLSALDPALLRRIEARTPTPRARLRALATLANAGVPTGLMLAPVLPGITDGREQLAALVQAAKAAGARWVRESALRLNPAARARFLPVLAREFPELTERYRRAYAGGANISPVYAKALRERVRESEKGEVSSEQ